LNDPAKVKPWLLKVTANVCRDRGRWWTRQVRRISTAQLTDLVDPGPDPADVVTVRADQSALWVLVRALPELAASPRIDPWG